MTSILSIGTQLRTTRKALGLSAPIVAERSAVHPNTLRALETGKGNIELARLLSICDTLGIDILLVPRQISAMQKADGALTSTELANDLASLMKVGK